MKKLIFLSILLFSNILAQSVIKQITNFNFNVSSPSFSEFFMGGSLLEQNNLFFEVHNGDSVNIATLKYNFENDEFEDLVYITRDAFINQNQDVLITSINSCIAAWETNRNGNFDIAYSKCEDQIWQPIQIVTQTDENETEISFVKNQNIFDYQRDLIEKDLGIRFYNWYGHSEKLILAGYCEHTNLYHAEPTYGYFELIDENGEVIRKPGGFGEIVGTSFHNSGMPFIRYRTGDYAEYVGDECTVCGRRLPVFKNVKGRWSGDRIYNADGSFVTTTALNLHNDLYQVINGIQYLQKKKGELIVLIVKSLQYTDAHEKRIYEHFVSKLHADSKILIKYVDKLIRKPNGKFVHIISEIEQDKERLMP